jgi:alpha-L-fucosidase
MYPESEEAQEFYKAYGDLTTEFGYKDLIPKFTAEKFDAEEWADLFAKSGAKFAGPVAEHHDGFAMWNTKWSEWNAAKMGPKRDVVGELEKAIKAKGMKFVTAFHHAANWFFFPTWDKTKDSSNPKYSGLYGPIHEEGAVPNKEFLDEWYGKLVEVVDKYDPDYIWFDFALDIIREDYVKNFAAYYYNKAIERNKEVIISYKHFDLPTGVGLFDLELGQEASLTHYDWITDTSIDDQGAWGYIPGLNYKPVNRLVDNLVDRVSKNGYLLMNIGPKWDGTIPEGAKKGLLGMGEWLKVNGEAIYGTTAWTKSGEGPTSLGMGEAGDAMFNESDIVYTSQDIRFTVKDNTLYAIALDWPQDEIVIRSLVQPKEEEEDDRGWWGQPWNVTITGDKMSIGTGAWPKGEGEGYTLKKQSPSPSWKGKWLFTAWWVTDASGATVEGPKEWTPGDEGGFGLNADGTFSLKKDRFEAEGNYTFEDGILILDMEDDEEEAEDFPGYYIYPDEIKSVTMLGDGKELEWELVKGEGLKIKTPKEKPCEHAFTFKIVRGFDK